MNDTSKMIKLCSTIGYLECIINNPPLIHCPDSGEVVPGFDAVFARGIIWGGLYSCLFFIELKSKIKILQLFIIRDSKLESY
jgi:hypothetical protein